MDSELIYFILIIFSSFFIYSLLGFGAGLVGIPLILIFMDAKLAIPAFVAIVFINGLFLIRNGWGYIQWKHVRRLLSGGLLGVPLGAACLKYLPSQAIALGANICVFIFACFYLFGIKVRLKNEHPVIEWVTGLVGGILSGGAGVGGPPIVMYGILRDWQKDVFHSTMLVYFVGLGVWTNMSLVLLKMHSIETGRLILIAWIPSLMASWVGSRVKKKVDEELFRRIVLIVIVLTSLLGIGCRLFS